MVVFIALTLPLNLTQSQFSSLAQSCLTATPWTAACQASLSITNSRSLSKLMSIESMMPSNHLILCRPLLLLPSIFPSIRVFSNESALPISGQSIGASASASILPMNIQTWFPLGLTGLISLLSKGLSRVFSWTSVRKHQFFGAQPSLWSRFHFHTWLLENYSPGVGKRAVGKDASLCSFSQGNFKISYAG